MPQYTVAWNRRDFVTAFSAALLTTPGLFAEELTRTPAQTEGPFFPDRLPLDTDNDLIIINDALRPGVGEITHLGGKILDSRGEPLSGAVVEIWQCDHNGAYLHSQSGNAERRDANFQGFGRFTTGRSGEYYFRTIKPVPYPGRAPHIHFKIKRGRQELLTTQCYVAGEASNQHDAIYRRLPNDAARQAVTVDFAPLKDSRVGERVAQFDIVLGHTPGE